MWIMQINKKRGAILDEVIKVQSIAFVGKINIGNFSYIKSWLQKLEKLSEYVRHDETRTVAHDGINEITFERP